MSRPLCAVTVFVQETGSSSVLCAARISVDSYFSFETIIARRSAPENLTRGLIFCDASANDGNERTFLIILRAICMK